MVKCNLWLNVAEVSHLGNKNEEKFHVKFTKGKFSRSEEFVKNIKSETKLFHVRYEINILTFPVSKIFVVCSEFQMGLKFHFFQRKIYFFQF